MGFTLGASFHSKYSTGPHIPHPNTHTHMGISTRGYQAHLHSMLF